jgi:histone acetyltransferase (RNA polymerase elongator complex component)
VSHSGCPNKCVFCNQKKINGVSEALEIDECKKIIDEALEYINKKSPARASGERPERVEIAFFGGSFTGIEEKRQTAYLELAAEYLYKKLVSGIRLSTRADYIDDNVLTRLKKYGVTTVELGIQSMNERILALNGRGMSVIDTVRAAVKIKEYGFKFGAQMMTAMYGSDDRTDIYSAREIIKLEPDFARIYPTVVIPDTELYELYKSGKYKVKTLEETVDLCAVIYEMFQNANIPVIRLGLMASDEINSKSAIGAYHEAFGELVMSKCYYNKIMAMIDGKTGGCLNIRSCLIIKAPREKMSQIYGHKKENLIKLKKIFREVIFENNAEFEIIIK